MPARDTRPAAAAVRDAADDRNQWQASRHHPLQAELGVGSPQLAPTDAPCPIPPALSARVHALLTEWEALNRAPYPRTPDGAEDEDAFAARCARMQALLATLSRTRCRTPLDTLAKLTVLCRTLREDLSPDDPDQRTTLLLAESIQDGVIMLALLGAPTFKNTAV